MQAWSWADEVIAKQLVVHVCAEQHRKQRLLKRINIPHNWRGMNARKSLNRPEFIDFGKTNCGGSVSGMDFA